MDNKTFVARVAKQMGADQKEVAVLIGAFAKVLGARASKLDSIAIPGFGNFVSVKLPEKVVENPETGERHLCPPQIRLEFVASTMLKKQIGNE